MTTRREFLGTLAGGLLASPLVAEAQQARVYRVGVVLQGGPYSGAIDGLRKGLAELGLEEGKQFILTAFKSPLPSRTWRMNCCPSPPPACEKAI